MVLLEHLTSRPDRCAPPPAHRKECCAKSWSTGSAIRLSVCRLQQRRYDTAMLFIRHSQLATFAVAVAYLATTADAGIPVYGLCQYMAGPLKALNPTFGCPPGTIFISQQDPRAKHHTVKSALDALPKDLSPQWLLIDKGEYEETLNISRKGPMTLLGATSTPNPQGHEANLVTIFNRLFMNQTTQDHDLQDNADISVLNVAPNKASAGSDRSLSRCWLTRRLVFRLDRQRLLWSASRLPIF